MSLHLGFNVQVPCHTESRVLQEASYISDYKPNSTENHLEFDINGQRKQFYVLYSNLERNETVSFHQTNGRNVKLSNDQNRVLKNYLAENLRT